MSDLQVALLIGTVGGTLGAIGAVLIRRYYDRKIERLYREHNQRPDV